MNNPDIDAAAAITRLLQEHPKGFMVGAGGELTPVSDALKITSLEDLSKLSLAPKLWQFSLPGGQVVELKLRPLNSVESTEIDDLLGDKEPIPPTKARPSVKGKPGEEYTDYQDKEYLKKDRKHYQLKRAAVIDRGVVDITIPGENLDEKAAWLQKAFPPRVLELIQDGILQQTSKSQVEKAVFI